MLAILIVIIGLLVAVLTMAFWMPRTWYRALLYPGGRPNAIARRMNSLSAWAGSRGVAPTLMVTLETKGRRTGKTLRVPMVVADYNGDRYLVSMLGENSDWLLNVRASNGEAVLIHGDTEKVRLEEIPIAERAPILKVYLKRAPGGRPHFDIDMNAPIEEFARVAPRYPVLRIVPI
jgi:deazaflavin-dependent oxidoreductase (nitroreductase family)